MCTGCGSNSPIPRGGSIEPEVSHATTTVYRDCLRHGVDWVWVGYGDGVGLQGDADRCRTGSCTGSEPGGWGVPERAWGYARHLRVEPQTQQQDRFPQDG